MSVHKRNGKWQVKWREGDGQRSRTFDRKGDADVFDLELRRRAQLGPVISRDLTRGATTLDRYIRTGFRAYAGSLGSATRKQYRWAIEHHLQELLDEPLSALTVPRLRRHQQMLLDTGRSANTVRDVMTRLSGILQVAVEDGEIPANPVRGVRKAKAEPREEVRPLTPRQLEAVIADFTGRDRIILVLAAHLGLRPLEIRSAPWADLTDTTLTISRARTKSSAAKTRVISLPAATRLELKQWRMQAGRPSPDEPIIGPLSKSGMTNWGWRHLSPAAKRITGREDVTLYTFRHSHASALHYCGHTAPSAARRLGHSIQVHWGYYAHVVEALEGQPKYADLDELIAEARASRGDASAELMFPQVPRARPEPGKFLQIERLQSYLMKDPHATC